MSITVVIPSYKYGHLAAHAIESVLNQTRLPDRVLFVDDGVGDCKHIPRLYPQIDFLERPKNLGIVNNFNDILFNRVDTDKVMFLGADNWLHPACIEAVWNNGASFPIVSYYAYLVGPWELNQGMNATNIDGYPVWLSTSPHGSSLYDVALARQVGGYEASGGEKSEEDSVLFRKMRAVNDTVYFIAEPYLYYRKHARNFQ